MENKWTEYEREFLIENLSLPVPVLAEKLERTEQGIRMVIHRRGFAAKKKKLEAEYVIRNHYGKSKSDMAKELGRSEDYIDDLFELPELRTKREIMNAMGFVAEKTVEEIVRKEEDEFWEGYKRKVKELSKVDLHKRCRIVNKIARGEKEDRRKSGNVLEGRFTKEYKDFYLFETDRGYRESLLKIDLVIGARKVQYL